MDEPIMNENYQKPIVGKNLLRMVMLQLYNNPRCIYREYIQNSLDAIHDAVETGVLKNNRDGLVSITINNGNIIIEDNGTGIKSSTAPKILMSIEKIRAVYDLGVEEIREIQSLMSVFYDNVC